jgi:hypothetical protein
MGSSTTRLRHRHPRRAFTQGATAQQKKEGKRVTTPGDNWSDEQLATLLPDEAAIRLAKLFAVGWATGDRAVMNTAITESYESGRQVKLLGAFAEWITQGLNLRNDVAALDAVREEIARHTASENITGTTPLEGEK